MKVKLYNSPLKSKKYRAIFFDNENNKIKHSDFGAKGMEDFTIHRNDKRKSNYLSRFQKLIKRFKKDPYAPITLSTMVLWNKTSLKSSWNDYKKHFGLE